MKPTWSVHPFGEAALLAEAVGDQTAANQVALAAAAALEADPPPGLIAVVPAISSLLIIVDPALCALDELEQRVRQVLEDGPIDREVGKVVPIAVRFDAEAGPDLAEAAATLAMRPVDLVEQLCAAPQRVMMIGFAPGYPYIGPLPPALHLPRRATPRAAVPAGSVAIAAGLAGIYPARLPGGWHLIGRTSAELFAPHSDPPSLLQAGDLVHFRPI